MIYLKALSALSLVIGLIGLFYYLGRRLNDRVTGGILKRRVQVLERTPLGEKRALLLVRIGQQQLLLGATSSTISMLSEVICDEPSESREVEETPQDKTGSKVSFRRVLEAIR